MSDLEAIGRWYLALTLVSVALLPFVAWLGAGLGSARIGLVRPLGVTALTAAVWWPAGVLNLPFNGLSLVIATIVLAVASWWLWWRNGPSRFSWRSILAFEALWLVLFLSYAWFRGFHPDIVNTEKPMEIALLSSISRSTEVPAPDPWLAGSTINYYYFGYQIIASLVRLSGVPPAIGFNLALATVFASAGTAAAAAAAGLLRAMRIRRQLVLIGGLLAVVLLLAAGNLETTARLIRDPSTTIDAGWWDGVGWQASRIIVDEGVHEPGDQRQTINEFPAFSFVLGDLHPHVLALPLLASLLALAIGLTSSHRNGRNGALRLAAGGGLVGLLYATNSWDAPTGFVLLLAASVFSIRDAGGSIRTVVSDVLAVLTGALVAALPFLTHFDAPVGVPSHDVPAWMLDVPVLRSIVSTFGIVIWRPSSASEILTVHGMWVVLCSVFLALVVARDSDMRSEIWGHRHLLLGLGLLVLGVAVAWMPAVAIIGIPLVVAIWVAVRSPRSNHQLIAALFAAGFGLVLLAELVYIQDVFADRMNTVFKLYFQAWLLLAVGSATAAVAIVSRVSDRYQRAVVGALAIGLAALLPYAPLSAHDWTDGFADRRGLDGEQFIGEFAPGDLAAIDWLRHHADEGDLVVEAPGCSYDVINGVPMNRVSAFTGIPTIVGWIGHEHQWRRGSGVDVWDRLQARADDANRVLDGTVPPTATDVRFVVVGQQELIGAATCDEVTTRTDTVIQSLESNGWTIAFERGSTVILVPDDDPAVASRR